MRPLHRMISDIEDGGLMPVMTATYTCPTSTHLPDGTPHTVIGCGATFEWAPDEEGIVDCPECGMFWKPGVEGD